MHGIILVLCILTYIVTFTCHVCIRYIYLLTAMSFLVHAKHDTTTM